MASVTYLIPGVDPKSTRHYIGPALGGQIRQARESLKIGQRWAAELVGIDLHYYQRLELGVRCPSVVVARDLIDGLRLDAALAARVMEVAVRDAGRDGPFGKAKRAKVAHFRRTPSKLRARLRLEGRPATSMTQLFWRYFCPVCGLRFLEPQGRLSCRRGCTWPTP